MFKTKAATAIKRSALGIVALILRDDTNIGTLASNVLTYKSVEDINVADWDATSLDYINKAFLGTPSKVICFKYDDLKVINEILVQVGKTRFNYLAMPQATADEVEAIATWIKSKRANEKKTFKAVLPNVVVADDEGIINFTTSDIVVGDTTYTAAQYTPRLAGIFAGLPFTQSSTYFVLPEVESITASDTPDDDIDSGQLILIHDGEKVKIGRGVNSLVTLGSTKKADYQKIKIIEIMDMIADDIRSTFEDGYVGKYPNIYDNQALFITAINAYFKGLQGDEILDPNTTNKAEVNVDKQRLAWEGIGTDTTDWDDQRVKNMTFGANVFLGGTVKPVDAMEDLSFEITV
nr:phage tail sheath C-terminal domain-containing protein [Lysinibacillus composti]